MSHNQDNPIVLVDVLAGYLTSALWSSNDDAGWSIGELAPESEGEAREDCQNFVAMCMGLLLSSKADSAQIGHDLWLTRNLHGVGFWDRPEMYQNQTVADSLSDIARAMGEVWPYVGDAGLIYFSK